MADRWDRLVAAVGEAAAMSTTAAQEYLREQFRDDADLLEEARTILDGGLDSDDFLSGNEGVGRASPHLAEGAAFGRYRVRRLLGRGGMGAVFLADQDEPRRAVALKVLESTLLSDRARSRFEYEVQVLASLRHRGIAQIYETGVQTLDDGLLRRDVPWFAMEYVEDASTLIEHVVANALSTERRLRLFLEVCDAVHHGHQKGVVHRDLKPENILVNGAGHIKVIDFGVARGLDAQPALTAATGPAEIVGTLPYLSPERVTAGSDAADVRADVYALGVVLYQLLTNRLPIEVDATDIVTSARRICEEQPSKPSTERASLPGDLDAITLTALAKEPRQRYASVDALADDVRRFLDHRPISARPLGTGYQLRLFVRRNRALVVSTAAVLVIAVAAAIISINWALESRRAEQQATEERAEAIEQRSKGERLFEIVFKRSFETTLREAPKLHKMPGGPERVKAMMDAVLEDLRVLESMSAGDARVQLLVAETWLRIGDTQGNWVYENLGDRDAMEESYRKALEVCQQVLDEHPTHRGARLVAVRSRIRLGDALDQAERALRMRGKRDKEIREERRALLQEALVMGRALDREDPDDRTPATNLIDAHERLARLAQDEKAFDVMRQHAQAIEDLHAAGRIESALEGKVIRAWSYFAAKEWKSAADAWAEVVKASAHAAESKDAPYTARFEHAMRLGIHGEAAAGADAFDDAVRSLERSISIFKQLAAEAPKDRRVDMQLQIQLRNLARFFRARAEKDSAQRVALLQKARDALVESVRLLGDPDEDSRRRARMRTNLTKKIEKLDDEIGE